MNIDASTLVEQRVRLVSILFHGDEQIPIVPTLDLRFTDGTLRRIHVKDSITIQ